MTLTGTVISTRNWFFREKKEQEIVFSEKKEKNKKLVFPRKKEKRFRHLQAVAQIQKLTKFFRRESDTHAYDS